MIPFGVKRGFICIDTSDSDGYNFESQAGVVQW